VPVRYLTRTTRTIRTISTAVTTTLVLALAAGGGLLPALVVARGSPEHDKQ